MAETPAAEGTPTQSDSESQNVAAGANANSSTTTVVSIGGSQKQIVALMAMGMVFSLIGAEITKAKNSQSVEKKATGALSEPVVILVGGTIATALLMFIAEMGPTGALIGKGLAGVSCATGVLVNGGPVWQGISNILGKPGGNTAAVGQAALAEGIGSGINAQPSQQGSPLYQVNTGGS